MMKNKEEKQPIISSDKKQNSSNALDVIIFVIISAYLLIDCVPRINIQDQMGLHWLLLSIANLISGIFIFSERQELLANSFKPIFKNSISILYFSFFLLSGLSLFVAINKVEGFVIYNRLLTTIISFSSVAILLNKRIYLLKNLAIVIALIVLAKSYAALSIFYSGLGKVDLNTIIASLQSSEGNKNIFAATLILQIPIIFYGIFVHKKWLSYLCALSLGFAVLTVFIINARAAYVSLLLELFMLSSGVFYLNYKNKSLKTIYKNAGIAFLAILAGLVISQRSLKKGAISSSSYGTVVERLSTITDQSNSSTTIRLDYWRKVGDAIKEAPFTGVGCGNWKLYSTKYVSTLLDDNTFSKHPHNDFLEIAAESGIINGLIYLFIFIAAFILTLKMIFSKREIERKFVAIVVFTSLAGYFVDAFFNFPLERPHMQILFVFVLVLIILNLFDNNEIIERKNSNLKTGIVYSIILLSCATIYVHYTVLQSMKFQYVVDNDLNAIDNIPDALPQHKYDEVSKMFPSFPNIAENSQTIGLKLAKYLRAEKRYDEAFKVLDSVHKFSPYTAYDYYLKSNMYQDLKKNDSAYVYAKKSFHAKPRNFYYYRMASYFAAIDKDSNEVHNLFNLYNSYRQEEQSFSYYAQSLSWSGYDVIDLKKIVEIGLKKYPKNLELLNLNKTLSISNKL